MSQFMRKPHESNTYQISVITRLALQCTWTCRCAARARRIESILYTLTGPVKRSRHAHTRVPAARRRAAPRRHYYRPPHARRRSSFGPASPLHFGKSDGATRREKTQPNNEYLWPEVARPQSAREGGPIPSQRPSGERAPQASGQGRIPHRRRRTAANALPQRAHMNFGLP